MAKALDKLPSRERRDDWGDIWTRIVTTGSLERDPPGITPELGRIYD